MFKFRNITLFLLLVLIFTLFRKNEFFVDKICNSNQNEIINNLWIGNYKSAFDIDFIKDNNICLIINLSKTIEFNSLKNIYKYRIPINDNLSEESNQGMINHFDKSYYLIDKYLKKNKGVLIHCRAGVQRSATLTALYLMKRYNIKSKEAMKIIKLKRNVAFYIQPNFQSVFNHFDSKFY